MGGGRHERREQDYWRLRAEQLIAAEDDPHAPDMGRYASTPRASAALISSSAAGSSIVGGTGAG